MTQLPLPPRTRFGLDRLGTLLTALVLAVVVWAVAVQQENPFEIRTFTRVPVAIRNLPEHLVLADAATTLQTVDVRLRAPRSVWDNLTSTDIEAYVDLNAAEAGRYEAAIRVDRRVPSTDVREIIPSAVVVRLEERVEVEVPVIANLLDSPPFGYEAGSAIVTPPTVRVSGARSLVETVRRAEVPVRLLDARSTIQVTEFVTLRDLNGAIVGLTRLIVEPRTVSIEVPIAQLQGFSEKPVLPRVEGQPAPGYRIVGVAADPATITLFGDPGALAEMPAFVETVPINIDGATEDFEDRVPLIVPETVSVVAAQAVKVLIGIEPIEGSLSMSIRPVIQGLDPSLQVDLISPETLSIILTGPIPRLQSLTDQSVRAVLELSNLGEGVHTIIPILVLPDGVTQQTMLPDSVQVTTSRRPTPTVTPTPSPVGAGDARPVTPIVTITPSPTRAP